MYPDRINKYEIPNVKSRSDSDISAGGHQPSTMGLSESQLQGTPPSTRLACFPNPFHNLPSNQGKVEKQKRRPNYFDRRQ